MSRRGRKVNIGDVFAVPLRDGTYGLGHVVSREVGGFACALFSQRAASLADLGDGASGTRSQPISILVLTDTELRDGVWPIIGNQIRDYSSFAIPTDGKGASHSADLAQDLLEAYYGMAPWDGMYHPDYFGRLLVPGTPIPPTIRYQRDFSEQVGQTAAAQSVRQHEVTEGPAEIHIQILYAGHELPTIEQLRKRQELERRLEADAVGEVTDAGAGEGVMDIYVCTDDVKRTLPMIGRIVGELGLAEDTLVEAKPLADDED